MTLSDFSKRLVLGAIALVFFPLGTLLPLASWLHSARHAVPDAALTTTAEVHQWFRGLAALFVVLSCIWYVLLSAFYVVSRRSIRKQPYVAAVLGLGIFSVASLAWSALSGHSPLHQLRQGRSESSTVVRLLTHARASDPANEILRLFLCARLAWEGDGPRARRILNELERRYGIEWRNSILAGSAVWFRSLSLMEPQDTFAVVLSEPLLLNAVMPFGLSSADCRDPLHRRFATDATTALLKGRQASQDTVQKALAVAYKCGDVSVVRAELASWLSSHRRALTSDEQVAYAWYEAVAAFSSEPLALQRFEELFSRDMKHREAQIPAVYENDRRHLTTWHAAIRRLQYAAELAEMSTPTSDLQQFALRAAQAIPKITTARDKLGFDAVLAARDCTYHLRRLAKAAPDAAAEGYTRVRQIVGSDPVLAGLAADLAAAGRQPTDTCELLTSCSTPSAEDEWHLARVRHTCAQIAAELVAHCKPSALAILQKVKSDQYRSHGLSNADFWGVVDRTRIRDRETADAMVGTTDVIDSLGRYGDSAMLEFLFPIAATVRQLPEFLGSSLEPPYEVLGRLQQDLAASYKPQEKE